MPKHKNFRELREKMSPEAQAAARSKFEAMIAEMPLHELRNARRMTQENLAEVLGIRQAAVSKMERQTDVYVSTLARFIQAMGGELEIRAVFPDGAVRISRFGSAGQKIDYPEPDPVVK